MRNWRKRQQAHSGEDLAAAIYKKEVFGQKNPQFRIFPRVPLLTDAIRDLGEDFMKFSAKTNDKNWSY